MNNSVDIIECIQCMPSMTSLIPKTSQTGVPREPTNCNCWPGLRQARSHSTLRSQQQWSTLWIAHASRHSLSLSHHLQIPIEYEYHSRAKNYKTHYYALPSSQHRHTHTHNLNEYQPQPHNNVHLICCRPAIRLLSFARISKMKKARDHNEQWMWASTTMNWKENTKCISWLGIAGEERMKERVVINGISSDQIDIRNYYIFIDV